jgi:hypothetical protein
MSRAPYSGLIEDGMTVTHELESLSAVVIFARG